MEVLAGLCTLAEAETNVSQALWCPHRFSSIAACSSPSLCVSEASGSMIRTSVICQAFSLLLELLLGCECFQLTVLCFRTILSSIMSRIFASSAPTLPLSLPSICSFTALNSTCLLHLAVLQKSNRLFSSLFCFGFLLSHSCPSNNCQSFLLLLLCVVKQQQLGSPSPFPWRLIQSLFLSSHDRPLSTSLARCTVF